MLELFRLIGLLLSLFFFVNLTEATANVRLVGGRTPYEGRLEVRKDSNDSWGTVCDDDFDTRDAIVVCRILGFDDTEYASVPQSKYGRGSGSVLLDDMDCAGNETDLWDCKSANSEDIDCGHSEDVGVNCQTPVRLNGGSGPFTGQVEVHTTNGSWEALCLDTFNENTGEVICRMLAFSTGNLEVQPTNPLDRNGKFYSKQPLCTGQENDITQCNLEERPCGSGKGVKLTCRTEIRLRGGPHDQSGRVEVHFRDTWGVICDDYFDDNAATVICQMLGYNPRGAKALGKSAYGDGDSDIIIDDLRCTGREEDISECKSNQWASHTSCNRNETASVACGTELRLADGPTSFSGRIEIKSKGVWKAMCGKLFDNKTAQVVCNMVGFPRGNISIHMGAYYGIGSNGNVNYSLECLGNETDIINCKHSKITLDCIGSQAVGINCFAVTPIRLVGGPTPYSGRVEVYMQEESMWKGVCDTVYGFTVNDARVLCKMFGKPNASPTVHTASGLYDYIIRREALGGLNCKGTENDISDCRSNKPWGNMSCNHPHYVGINCDPVTSIRLVGGSSNMAGRVEILYNGTWGGICSNGFTIVEATVICRMLGSNTSPRLLSSNEYLQGNISNFIDTATCSGSERDISDCRSLRWGTRVCTSGENVGITCKTQTRLANGTSNRTGRVETFIRGKWTAMCAEGFDKNAANVVCRMIGLNVWNVTVLPGSYFGRGNITSYFNETDCQGDEQDIALCKSSPWTETSCKDDLVASVDCQFWETQLRLVNGKTAYSGGIEVFFNDRWGPICEAGFSRTDAGVVCKMLGYNFSEDYTVAIDDYDGQYASSQVIINNLNCKGNETDLSQCDSDEWDYGSNECTVTPIGVGVNCSPVRLIGGTNSMGAVEIKHRNEWTTICRDNFVTENVFVICSMMALQYTKEYRLVDYVFQSNNNIKPSIQNLNCTGQEKDIHQCPSSSWNGKNCSNDLAAAVSCNTPVHLADGRNRHSGRVEFFQNDKWHEICYDDGNPAKQRNIGKVVCRMMMLSALSPATFPSLGNNNASTILTCRGSEDDISECQRQNGTCQNVSRLGISCDTGIQLVRGRTVFMGAIQIYLYRTWVSIRNMPDNNALGVVCRMLGYNFTRYQEFTTADQFRTSSSEYTGIYQMSCDGNETDVMDCKIIYEAATTTTTHYKGVNCQTPLRLANGSMYQFGRVEIKDNVTWHPICSKNFSLKNAYVICRMLGHHHAYNATIQPFSLMTGETSYMSDLHCNGEEDDISQCNFNWKNDNCSGGGAVVIDCRSTIRLVDGPTKFKGRVEVYYNGRWGPINSRTSSYSANLKLLCKMLGYNYAGAVIHSGTPFTNVTIKANEYMINKLVCVGTEEDITECSSDRWQNGTVTDYYSAPLEIECNTPISLSGSSHLTVGLVQVNYNDTYSYVCGDNFTLADADVVCRKIGHETYGNATIYYHNKFGSGSFPSIISLQCTGNETDLQECQLMKWEPYGNRCNKSNNAVGINCRPHTSIRLVGNDTLQSSGLVEINYDGTWGTICNDEFDVLDASVLCKMLTYKIGLVGTPVITNKNDVIIRRSRCTGTENDISECNTYGNTWYTGTVCYSSSYNKKATVKCSDDRVRLLNGINDYQGRVQFQYFGKWGSVCNTNFDTGDAYVVCRKFGFQPNVNVKTYSSTRFGSSSSDFMVDDLKCDGNETDLDECGSYPWSTRSASCSNYQGADVNCRPKTPARLVNGTKYTGRVEIEYKGEYGTICDREFGENDARVICRTLGLNPLSASYKVRAFYGEGSGKITISNLKCTGNEPDISECGTSYGNDYKWNSPHPFCEHKNDVSVLCNTPVRVTGGWTDYDGQVELYINGSWKSVCYEGFTLEDAQAVCNIIGFRNDNQTENNIKIHRGVYFGFEHATPTVGQLRCNGTEDDLYLCRSGVWTTNVVSCNEHNIAAINCRPVTSIRLMNKSDVIDLTGRGKLAISGRIEVYYKNVWGAVCDDKFDDGDAYVFCKMLGFSVGKVYRGREFGNTTTILVDDLDCLGIEDDISECRAREWGTHNCDRSEEVALTCDYKENIDPCYPKEHTTLPNLELRFAKIRTNTLRKSYNDSKLPLRWYKVGNNTMPSEVNSTNRCGTHFPIFSSDKPPKVEETVSIKANQVGDDTVQYDIEVKHCVAGYFVYRLGPTRNDQSGYCFGIGTDEPPPSFVAKNVATIIGIKGPNIYFACKFQPSTEDDLVYQVNWMIRGKYQETLTKQYYNRTRLEELHLTEKDFDEHAIGLGINISCAIRAFRKPGGQPGQLSEVSNPYFAGIKILTPSLRLRKGETKAIEFINTLPLVCPAGLGSVCKFQLQHMIPQYGTCSSGISFQDNVCSKTITNSSYSKVSSIYITTSETGQYGTAGHFQVNLVYKPNNNPDPSYRYISLWKRQYKLPAINVEVLPETDRSWRGKICSARNDPHMNTFNSMSYEHHEQEGEYILYRHKNYTNVEIQHKIASCVGTNGRAKCNCGMAVRAGRDVYVINVCDRLFEIGYKYCGDETLTVKKDNDFTYTVYLPYGTAVRTRIDNQPFMGKEGGRVLDISILPSVHDDNGLTRGLCGTLDKSKTDEMHYRNENVGNLLNHERSDIIKSWTVLQNESLFSKNVYEMELEEWLFPTCVCKDDHADVPATCERSTTKCTPGIQTGQHICEDLASKRSKRSVGRRPRIPVVMQSDHYATAYNHHVGKRDSNTIETLEEAMQHCLNYFKQLAIFTNCQKLPATHTNVSVRNCALDIMLANNTNWIELSLQSMQDTCTTAIHRNASVRQEELEKAVKSINSTTDTREGTEVLTTILPQEIENMKSLVEEIQTIETFIKEIKVSSCLHNCSGHGLCSDGICKCDENFGATDCSLDIKKPPRLVDILDKGMCDKNKRDCSHIYVFGEIFFGKNVTCCLRKFTMRVQEGSKRLEEAVRIPGKADTLTTASCPTTSLRRRRSVVETTSSAFVHGFQVSVSNDGVNFANETLNVYIYNSSCQVYDNSSSMGMVFNLKTGYCHIEGECVSNGTLAMHQTVICDTKVSKFSWTQVPTLTPNSTIDQTDPNTVIDKIVASDHSVQVFKIEIRIGISLPSSDNLSVPATYQRYLEETKTALLQYYKPILGYGLKDIIIIALQSGSLKVEHAVIVQKEDFVVKALSVAIANFTRGAKLRLSEQEYSVSDVTIDQNKVGTQTEHYLTFILCEIFTSLHPCDEHESCVLEEGSPTCNKLTEQSKDTAGNTNLIIIISSTVCGVMVVIIIALVAVICCNRKKPNNRLDNYKQTSGQNEYHDMNDREMVQIPRAKYYSDGKNRGQTTAADNPTFRHDDRESAMADTTLDSRLTSANEMGSYRQSNDGYIYYSGKM